VGRLRGFSEEALATVDDLHTLIITNRPALDTAGSNLVLFTEQLNQFGGSLNGLVATNQPTINQLVKNIESSTVVLKNLLDDLQAGKGLAGSLIKNEETALHVSQIASNLSVTTSNINRLGLWGVLWQHKPPKSSPSPKPLEAPKRVE
jgi:ABC-type transporter Mla subunit MlaD